MVENFLEASKSKNFENEHVDQELSAIKDTVDDSSKLVGQDEWAWDAIEEHLLYIEITAKTYFSQMLLNYADATEHVE